MSSATETPNPAHSSDSSNLDRQPDINNDPAVRADNGENDDDDDDDDDDDLPGGELPMSMTASVLLTNLPQDASQALKDVEAIDDRKVTVRFQPIQSAPSVQPRVFKISASSRFSVVLSFLRKKLALKDSDGLFLYLHNCFAPGLDEGVGNLFRCFKTDEQLIVSYSITPAYG